MCHFIQCILRRPYTSQTLSISLLVAIILIIMKSLDPLRAKKIFIRKKLGHTAVSAIKAIISDPIDLAKGASGKYCKFAIFNMAVVSKNDISRKIPKYFKFV